MTKINFAMLFFNSKYWLYLLLFSVPILTPSPWQVLWAPPLYYGFIFVFFALVTSISFCRQNGITRNNGLIFILLLMFWCSSFISLLLNWGSIPVVQLANMDFKAPHIYNVFLLVFLLFNIFLVWLLSQVINSQSILKRVIQVLLLSAGTVSLWGILTVMAYMAGWHNTFVFLGTAGPRLMGTATEPQVFGNFLLMVFPLAMALLFQNREQIFNDEISLALVYIMSMALVMTFSAGAWIGAAAGIILLFVMIRRLFSLMVFKKLLILVIMLLFSFTLINQVLYPGYSNGFIKYSSKFKFWDIQKEEKLYFAARHGEDLSFNDRSKVEQFDDKVGRLWMAQTAINMFRAKPILGIGLGNYGFLYDNYRPPKTPEKAFSEKAHNAYLEVLAESGVLGFVCFMSFLAVIFFQGIRAYLNSREEEYRLLMGGLLAGGVALLVHGATFGILVHNYTWVLFGLILVAANVCWRSKA